MSRMQDAEEFVYVPKKSRSMYLDMVANVIQRFKDHPEKRVFKLTFKFPADADQTRKGVRAWMSEDDHKIFDCTKRGTIVYFVRIND